MATTTQIQMDFAKAMDISNKINESAEEISAKVQTKFTESTTKLNNNWKGENATEFMKKTSIVADGLENSVVLLQNLASAIAKIAKNTYDAEMAALEAVKTNSQTV